MASTETRPGLDAGKFARRLVRSAKAWVGTFRSGATLDGAVVEPLERETLAFALSLLELQLDPSQNAGNNDFFQRVTQESWSALRGNTARSMVNADSVRTFQLSSPSGDGSEFGCQFLQAASQSGGFVLTDQMFQDFCAETGLGSKVLVGRGENLASLIFYIVLHGRVFAQGKPTSEQKRWVLRAARDYRMFFQDAIQRWLKGE